MPTGDWGAALAAIEQKLDKLTDSLDHLTKLAAANGKRLDLLDERSEAALGEYVRHREVETRMWRAGTVIHEKLVHLLVALADRQLCAQDLTPLDESVRLALTEALTTLAPVLEAMLQAQNPPVGTELD
jgi:hypothetical protein